MVKCTFMHFALDMCSTELLAAFACQFHNTELLFAHITLTWHFREHLYMLAKMFVNFHVLSVPKWE